MLVVNLFGGPGSGKSTLALLVAGLLKTQHPSLTTECPNEVAKGIVYDGALKALGAQLYISGRQWWRIAQCDGHADIVVCDSPILMSAVYGRQCLPPMPTAFEDVCKFHHDQFPTLNYYVERRHPYETSARVQDEVGADALADRIRHHLDAHLVRYEVVQSSGENARHIARAAAQLATTLKNTKND